MCVLSNIFFPTKNLYLSYPKTFPFHNIFPLPFVFSHFLKSQPIDCYIQTKYTYNDREQFNIHTLSVDHNFIFAIFSTKKETNKNHKQNRIAIKWSKKETFQQIATYQPMRMNKNKKKITHTKNSVIEWSRIECDEIGGVSLIHFSMLTICSMIFVAVMNKLSTTFFKLFFRSSFPCLAISLFGKKKCFSCCLSVFNSHLLLLFLRFFIWIDKLLKEKDKMKLPLTVCSR